ncbi:hypothetical protein [Sinomicrobium sp. M5D2P17]
MSGGGSIQGMINSLRNNKKLLRSKRLFSKEKTFLNIKKEYLKAAGGKLDFKKASKEDIIRIRKRVIKERQKDNILLIAIATISITIASYFTFKLVKQNYIAQESQKAILLKKKDEEFLTLIQNGDEWFEKAKWNNAVFYYKKAKELFPENYDINYRIVNSYSLQCEREFKNCIKAKKILDNLFLKFPDKKKELTNIKGRLEYEY